MDNFVNYLKATAAEMKQVAWPTQSQALMYTALVIGISTFVAIFTGFFDYILSLGIEALIQIV